MLFFAPVSCFALAATEIDRRKEAALAREIELCATHRSQNGRYGREILWHPDFAADCVAIVGDLPLSEVTAWLASELPGYANEGAPLDLTDYCYLADVLREGLASPITSLARVRLERALLWVEQTGADILKPRPAAAPAQAVPSPALAA
ncbi:MAG: hypothetical protein ACRYFZ_01730 [Janthinobacterium lividum]